MKKFLAIVLALVIVAAFAACAKTDVDPTDVSVDASADVSVDASEDVSADVSEEVSADASEEASEEVSEEVSEEAADDSAAVAALTTVWNKVIADEALLTAFGASSSEELAGYFAGGDSFTMGAPASYTVGDAEAFGATFGIAADKVDLVSDLATIMHAMNGNNLTAAAYTLIEGTDAAAFAADLKTSVSSMQFLCGAPEMHLVADVDGVIISAFGGTDIINAFKTAVSSIEGATVISEGAIG